jgi:hypothetical protein
VAKQLFRLLEEEAGILSRQARLLISVVSMQPLACWRDRSPKRGYRSCSRQCLATTFLANFCLQFAHEASSFSAFEPTRNAPAPSVALEHDRRGAHRSDFFPRLREFAAAGLPHKSVRRCSSKLKARMLLSTSHAIPSPCAPL